MSPGRASRMMDEQTVLDGKPHLMPRPSPRKLDKARDFSESPEIHRRQSSVDKS